MGKETLIVPDIGGAEDAEVIELLVAVGDRVAVEQSLIVLESDKASMEIPATAAGTVLQLLIKEGDNLGEGGAILVLETDAAPGDVEAATEVPPTEASPTEASPTAAEMEEDAAVAAATAEPERVERAVVVPDIGTPDPVEVIEICIAVGDVVAEGDSLLVLESDKASMEIPSPFAGEVVSLSLAEGAMVIEGDAIGRINALGVGAASAVSTPKQTPEVAVVSTAAAGTPAAGTPAAGTPAAGTPAAATAAAAADIYAGPAVRKLAREFGLNLADIAGSGPKGRLLKEDLQEYVKKSLTGGPSKGGGSRVGAGIPPIPAVDFSAFGEVDVQPLSKMARVTAANMQRSWLNVPHVTQFDEIDISELEVFRGEMKSEAAARGVKLTPLPFLFKACAAALRANPQLNSSLAEDGEHIVYKDYVHIGMAVDTPAGLVVPVIRDVDTKNLWQLAEETAAMAQKAKERKLRPVDMQGGCFTISSLGAIGGQGFTPIVNAPEVAILGVSRLTTKPVWNGSEFLPRKLLPLALSYDHRVVNGGDGGRFFTHLSALLADIRRLLL